MNRQKTSLHGSSIVIIGEQKGEKHEKKSFKTRLDYELFINDLCKQNQLTLPRKGQYLQKFVDLDDTGYTLSGYDEVGASICWAFGKKRVVNNNQCVEKKKIICYLIR